MDLLAKSYATESKNSYWSHESTTGDNLKSKSNCTTKIRFPIPDSSLNIDQSIEINPEGNV